MGLPKNPRREIRNQWAPVKSVCRFMGPDATIANVSPEKVNVFLAGKGPLTASWHVKYSALRGFYRYAVSRGLVVTSPLPDVIPKRPSAFQPYIYSQAELRRLLDSIESCRRRRSAGIRSAVVDCRRRRSGQPHSHHSRFKVFQDPTRSDWTQHRPTPGRLCQTTCGSCSLNPP